jgi:phosphoribosylcarboxyaminoimidazole (NCAIR) mutase
MIPSGRPATDKKVSGATDANLAALQLLVISDHNLQ